MQNSDKVRYADLKFYMHNRYITGNDRWPKALSASLKKLVNWRGGVPVQQYEYIKGVSLTTKFNMVLGETTVIAGIRGTFPGTFLNPGKKKLEIPTRHNKMPRSRSTYKRKKSTEF